MNCSSIIGLRNNYLKTSSFCKNTHMSKIFNIEQHTQIYTTS